MLNVPITAKSEQNTWRVLSYFQQNYTKTSNMKPRSMHQTNYYLSMMFRKYLILQRSQVKIFDNVVLY